jgi:hypothetical protein
MQPRAAQGGIRGRDSEEAQENARVKDAWLEIVNEHITVWKVIDEYFEREISAE